MPRGKALPFDVIREIKRLKAEGRSINSIVASLRERGLKVGRSTVVLYTKDVRPKAEPEAREKPEPVASVEKGLPQPDQSALRPEVRYMYERLVRAGALSKETSLFDFVNMVMMAGYEALREAEKRGAELKEGGDELARLIGKPVGKALGELLTDLLFRPRELKKPEKFQ